MTNDDMAGAVRPDENDPDRRADEIVAQIDETRDDMTETIHAIGEKLEPGNVVRGATNAVRDATTGKVEQVAIGARETWDDVTTGNASGIIDTIKSNPVPAGMIALGLGMLFLSRGAATETRARGRYGWSTEAPRGRPSWYGRDRGYDETDRSGRGWTETAGSAAGRFRSSVGDTASDAGESVARVADRARRTAGDVAESVTEGAGDVAESVGQGASDFAEGVGRTAGRYSDRASDMISTGGTQFGRMMDENPLVVGIVAVAAGAAAGLLIPTTEPERRTLGPVRDRLVEQAGDSVGTTLDRVSSQTSGQSATSQDWSDDRSQTMGQSSSEAWNEGSSGSSVEGGDQTSWRDASGQSDTSFGEKTQEGS